MTTRARASLVLSLALVSLGSGLASAEVTQRGNLRVSFTADLTPKALPRRNAAPVAIRIGGRIVTTDGQGPPQLRRIQIQIDRHGRLDRSGLPACAVDRIQPSTNAEALRFCGGALVGEGRFSAKVTLPGQAPFPSRGRVLAFNANVGGRPAMLAHVYGTEPAPTSYTIPFLLSKGNGRYGTVLTADLPPVASGSGSVTGLSMTLRRSFAYRGARRSYLSASCPAPSGFPGAVFALAKASFGFAGGRTLTSTLTRSCEVRG